MTMISAFDTGGWLNFVMEFHLTNKKQILYR